MTQKSSEWCQVVALAMIVILMILELSFWNIYSTGITHNDFHVNHHVDRNAFIIQASPVSLQLLNNPYSAHLQKCPSHLEDPSQDLIQCFQDVFNLFLSHWALQDGVQLSSKLWIFLLLCHWYFEKNKLGRFSQLGNRTAHIRHQCRKTTLLSCHRCLINTGVEKMSYN